MKTAATRRSQGYPRTGPESETPRPFLKWAGGKWRLAEEIAALLPPDVSERTYREPFLGGGAIFFYLASNAPPAKAILSDALTDLITTYRMVKTKPADLLARLESLQAEHSKEMFYAVRQRFNEERDASDLDRASWFVYLNKTCFNGLFRTNRDGIFNVPFGQFDSPRVADEPRITAASGALAKAKLFKRDFDHLDGEAEKGDVIYFDPPYVPLSKTASFASYADGAFGSDDQKRLANLFRALDERGCLLALSNSDTPEVRSLYQGFDIQPIVAARVISSKTSERKPVGEVLVRNLRRYPGQTRARAKSPRAE